MSAVVALCPAERQRCFRARKKRRAASYWFDADDRVLEMLRRRKYIEEHKVRHLWRGIKSPR
jgi:hypothetical protein